MNTFLSRFILPLFVLILSGLGSANAGLIDFEDLAGVGPGGTVSATRYQANGVVFDNNGFAYNHPDGGANSAGWSLDAGNFGGIGGSFVNAVDSMSILVGDWCCDFDQATLSVFDASNNLLGTSSGSGTSWFTLSVTANGISRFSIAADGAVLYDNLSFRERGGANEVPEPTSLALLGLGVIGLAVVRRRIKA